MATANEPSAGIDVAEQGLDPSSARTACRSGRRCRPAPRRAPRAAGRPRSSRCRAARSRRSSRRTSSSPEISSAAAAARRATEAAISAGEFERRGDRSRRCRRRRRRHSGQRQHQRQRRGQNDHAHGLHHGDRRHVGALLGGEHGDLRQRAGAAGQQRRGLVPAVHALQIEAAAEGRAEGRERQQRRWSADRRSCAGSVAATPASPAKSRAAPARSGSGSAACASGRPASAAMPTAIIAPEISPPGRFCPQKQQAAGGADDERLERVEDFGAAGNGRAPSMRGSGSRRLMANPHMRDKCANATAAMRGCVVSFGVIVPQARGGGAERLLAPFRARRPSLHSRAEFLALLAVQPLGVGLLRAFERGCGARFLSAFFRRRLGLGLVASRRWRGAGGLRERGAHQQQEAQRRSRWQGKKSVVMGHLGLKKGATVAPRC